LYSAGSLKTHTIRELWSKEPLQYSNESCMGCGKQRFRSHTLKHLEQSLRMVARAARSCLSGNAETA
jgi:hypothetical protein